MVRCRFFILNSIPRTLPPARRVRVVETERFESELISGRAQPESLAQALYVNATHAYSHGRIVITFFKVEKREFD